MNKDSRHHKLRKGRNINNIFLNQITSSHLTLSYF